MTSPMPAWRPLLLLSGGLGVLLLAVSSGYGYHRDELYFLAAGRRLAWGYVDQPPLTPLLARLADEVAGGALPVLRAPAAVAAAGTVLLVGLTARELGGGRWAQLLAAAVTAASAYTLIVGHMLSTSSVDLLVWTAVGFLTARILATGRNRLWLAVGAVAGVGMLNKSLVAFLGVAPAVGLLLAAREQLRGRWLWAGAGIMLLLALPNLAWQAGAGWPQLEMAAAIREEELLGGRALLLPFQLLVPAPLLAPLWMVGLVWLLRSLAGARFRVLGWAYLALLLLFLVAGGQPYYPAGWYGPLLAAGAVSIEAWLRQSSARAYWRRTRLLAAAVAFSAVGTCVLALPLLPVDRLSGSPVGLANPDALETVGWPQFVDDVLSVWHALPEDERREAVLLTGNYGQAGALEQLGGRDLPVVSGHNSYADWAIPAPGVGTAVVVGVAEPRLVQLFGRCEQAGWVDNEVGVPNEEQGTPVWRCHQPLQPWPQLWPRIRHYN